MKLITFLGRQNYAEVRYVWNGQEAIAKFAPVASFRFLKPSRVLVMATEEAQEETLPELQEQIPAHILQPIPIPSGRNERELWQIMDQISQLVQPGERVAFDITHGFRSLPAVAILASAFLRAARRADIAHVLYGAYEARDTSTTPPLTPMFDLTPMVSLLEWASAADRFNRTGDARDLAALLAQQRRILAAEHGDREGAGAIGRLSGTLHSVSQALRLNRTHDAMRAVDGLLTNLEESEQVMARLPEVLPFQLLTADIREAYRPLALAAPEADVCEDVRVQREMIRWYAERDQWVQAATLAREWVVSWVMIYQGSHDLRDHTQRQAAETDLNLLVGISGQRSGTTEAQAIPTRLAVVPNLDQVKSLWEGLRETRNDINHAAMRHNASPAKKLITATQKHIDVINELPLPDRSGGEIA